MRPASVKSIPEVASLSKLEMLTQIFRLFPAISTEGGEVRNLASIFDLSSKQSNVSKNLNKLEEHVGL